VFILSFDGERITLGHFEKCGREMVETVINLSFVKQDGSF
jgi:hypothetical protein